MNRMKMESQPATKHRHTKASRQKRQEEELPAVDSPVASPVPREMEGAELEDSQAELLGHCINALALLESRHIVSNENAAVCASLMFQGDSSILKILNLLASGSENLSQVSFSWLFFSF